MGVVGRSYLTGALSALLLAGSMTAGYAQSRGCEPETAAERYPSYVGKVVKIAASPTQPPYAFADPADLDRMVGLEVELIQNTMRCVGLKYEFVRGSWVGLLQAMFSGGADVMVGNVNYRPDRGEKLDFVIYTRAGSAAVVVPKGNPKKIVEVGSLCGRIGAAIAGGSSALIIDRQSKLCVESGKPAVDFRAATDPEAAYRQVQNGRVDFAMDDFSFVARAAKDPEVEVGFTMMGNNVGGMVIPKGNADMLAAVTAGLKIQERDGRLAALMTKYDLPLDMLVPVEARK